MIITKTPLRISFVGGGTDLKEFYKNSGGQVISATIDKYVYVEARGVSPKSNTLSCIKKKELIMPGGILASYKFLSSITNYTSLVSVVNSDLYSNKTYKKLFENSLNLI